jgi:hypothetical protein
MLRKIYAAYDGGLAMIESHGTEWRATITLKGIDCQCLAVDPNVPARIYCGAFGAGLWHSDDAGATWDTVTTPLPHKHVMAVAVSTLTEEGGRSIVWAGTEPSALFRSADGGITWQECRRLLDLPSKSSWSFPPRPWTHHVRWIEPDACAPNRIFAGIELGGVMRSVDGGESWEDRKAGSQHDCHTLRTHPDAPGLIYEAAGGGFAVSRDGGATWHGDVAGLDHHYLWGLAVDPASPETVIVSASPGARAAHSNEYARAQLYRKSGRERWQALHHGLPAPDGTRAFVLATHPAESGVFYAATRRQIYHSTDGGLVWQPLAIRWPNDVDFTTVNALEVARHLGESSG